jgi:cytoskeletal protein CcmA (bactofilin family)
MFFSKKTKPKPNVASAPQATARPTGPSEPSYIGRDTIVDGHITSDGEVHVDGTVRGAVRAQVCVIDQHGVVDGEVTGEVVHVRGRIIGPIQGSKVYIHAGSHVEGDVFQDTISIENGAYVYGTIRHNVPPPSSIPAFPPPVKANGAADAEQTSPEPLQLRSAPPRE